MPNNKSASANPVGSWTPFSLEQASQRFTFCIFPSIIWVRKTEASLHLQTSQSMANQLDHISPKRFNWHTVARDTLPFALRDAPVTQEKWVCPSRGSVLEIAQSHAA